MYKISEELINKYNYVIIKRKDYIIKQEFLNKKNIQIIENEEYAKVSSITVRKLIKERKDVKEYVLEEVEKYITKKELYR